MMTVSHTPDGFIYNLKGEVIGIGTYTGTEFILLESDNTTSTHYNGMTAMSYLRNKYTPEYYTMPLKKSNIVIPRETNKLSKYKAHPALEGVHPLAME